MSNHFQIKNVRLSFPSLFQKARFNGDETKYEATFLISKSDVKTKKLIDERIELALSESKIKVAQDKYCMKDGDESEYDGYGNCWSFKAGSNKRPVVLNVDKSSLTEDDNIIYAGCYVNAIVDIWIQNNDWGKRVNANLYGVQFVRDGESFGAGPVDVQDDFEDLTDI